MSQIIVRLLFDHCHGLHSLFLVPTLAPSAPSVVHSTPLFLTPLVRSIGSLEVCRPTDSVTGRAGPSAGSELKLLPMLLDHVIATCYPHLWADLAHRLGMHEAAPGSEGSKGPVRRVREGVGR